MGEFEAKATELAVPETVTEMEQSVAKVHEVIGRLEPKDFTELSANMKPVAIVARVLYAVLQVVREGVKVFEVDVEEKTADPAMWAYVRGSIA